MKSRIKKLIALVAGMAMFLGCFTVSEAYYIPTYGGLSYVGYPASRYQYVAPTYADYERAWADYFRNWNGYNDVRYYPSYYYPSYYYPSYYDYYYYNDYYYYDWYYDYSAGEWKYGKREIPDAYITNWGNSAYVNIVKGLPSDASLSSSVETPASSNYSAALTILGNKVNRNAMSIIHVGIYQYGSLYTPESGAVLCASLPSGVTAGNCVVYCIADGKTAQQLDCWASGNTVNFTTKVSNATYVITTR